MWLWSKLSSKKWQDAWEERFHGNANAVISEITGGKTIRLEVYTETENEATLIKDQFGGSMRELKMKNWVGMAELERKALKIRDALIVVSGDDKAELDGLEKEFPERKIIKMPAEMAFGTGDHATTSTCLRMVVDIAREKNDEGSTWDMLDLGCGTAILAIAAKHMGACSCEAHDFDPQAVKVSKSNLILNEVKDIKVLEQDVLTWTPTHKWDVVVANMFSTILQAAFPTIVESMQLEAHLVISGILADQWEETKLVGEANGLEFSQVVQKGKWVTARGHLTQQAR